MVSRRSIVTEGTRCEASRLGRRSTYLLGGKVIVDRTKDYGIEREDRVGDGRRQRHWKSGEHHAAGGGILGGAGGTAGGGTGKNGGRGESGWRQDAGRGGGCEPTGIGAGSVRAGGRGIRP